MPVHPLMRGAAPPPDRAVWLNGELRRAGEASISLFDRGARDGEGLFETVRVEAGRPLLWAWHLERLVLSAAELGFPVPPAPAVLRRALDEVLGAGGLADAAARITVTRGIAGGRPTRAGCWIEAEPLAARVWRGARAGGATAILSRVPHEPGVIGRHKTTSRIAYHLAREEARAARADEALLADPQRRVLEGAVSNLFAVWDGVLRTPPLRQNVLPGVMRRWVLNACAALAIPVREEPIPLADLERADEMFLTNSIQTVVPLARLEGRELPAGPLAARLLEQWREERAGESAA